MRRTLTSLRGLQPPAAEAEIEPVPRPALPGHDHTARGVPHRHPTHGLR